MQFEGESVKWNRNVKSENDHKRLSSWEKERCHTNMEKNASKGVDNYKSIPNEKVQLN